MTCGMNLELGLEALRRVYRSSRAEQGVEVIDEVHLDVAVLPVLSDAAMREIVREVLRGDGWTQRDDGSLEKSFGDAVATLSPDASGVTLRVRTATTVSATGSAAVEKDTGERAAQREAERRAAEALKAVADKERERLSAENMKALTREEPTLRAEVQRALNRTYRRALEERARQMGEVESINERGDEGGSYEVTVVVKA